MADAGCHLLAAMQPYALSAFDYALPDEAIATEPASPRDASRLLCLPATGHFSHHKMGDLPQQLVAGDVLVFNTTKVVPARLLLRRKTGARVECLALAPIGESASSARRWTVMTRNAQAVGDGETLLTAGGARLSLCRDERGTRILECEEALLSLLEREGDVPLPPYIRKLRHEHSMRQADASDYQSMFARDAGAVAAPTASLHFTPSLLQAIRARGVIVKEVCLHVGAGTFLPVRPEHEGDVRKHEMHQESYDVPRDTQTEVRAALAEGRRVVPVGTTSLRAIETWAQSGLAQGDSQLFIVPGHRFRVTSALVTNFHTPKSTLLMLVSALAGRERILAAYQEALKERYRFLSYGDAMFIDASDTPSGELCSPHL